MMADDDPNDMVEKCLRIFHGPTSWSAMKNQWPEAALIERRRKMADVIAECALEARRMAGCLLAISGAEGCGNGALRTAAYEAATKGATPGELAIKLGLPGALREWESTSDEDGQRERDTPLRLPPP